MTSEKVLVFSNDLYEQYLSETDAKHPLNCYLVLLAWKISLAYKPTITYTKILPCIRDHDVLKTPRCLA